MNRSKQNRRSAIIVSLLLVAAVTVLFVVNSGGVAAYDHETEAGQQRTLTTDTASKPWNGSSWESLLRMMSALVIVIACIYGGIYLLRRLMGRKYGGNRARRTLEVLDTIGVGPKKTVSLIRVVDKAVVVGVSEAGMTTLTELTPEQTAEVLEAQLIDQPQERFGQMLKTATIRFREVGLGRKHEVAEA